MAQPLGLGGEFGVLPGLRFDGGDLLQAEAQQVGLLGAFAGAGGELVQFGGDGAQPLVRRPSYAASGSATASPA